LYTIVTGAAGFIGANLVKALNRRGELRIIAVDNMARADKCANLVDCEIVDYLDKEEFLVRLADGDFDDDVGAILHQGACSDTMETDGRYMMRNNYRYSVTLLDWCQSNDVPFLYASSAAVYGAGTVFREERAVESPLNVYGYSKFLFDQYVRRALPERTAQIAGFRYFNVYGPREQHKERMASVVWHFYRQFGSEGRGRRQGEPRFSRSPGSQRHLQRRHREGNDLQRGRCRDHQCVPCRSRRTAPIGRGAGGVRRHLLHSVSARARGQVSESHRGGSRAASCRRLRRADARDRRRRRALRRTADFRGGFLRVACGTRRWVAHAARCRDRRASSHSRRRQA
jgi:hypothetical protein